MDSVNHNNKIVENDHFFFGKVNEILNPKERGYDLSYIDEESCMIVYKANNFYIELYGLFSDDDINHGTYSAKFARLNAQIDNRYMIWHGEKCHCWHNSDYRIPSFLNGYSAEETVGKSWKNIPEINAYISSNFGKELMKINKMEYFLYLQSTLLDNYGIEFEKLFDLNNEILWNKYKSFLRDYYSFSGFTPYPNDLAEQIPNPWVIC